MSIEITSDHLSKKALVYVRQSSPNQVRNHLESQRLQYNLVDRARQLGWPEQQIVVLDDDLGVTATGVKKRRSFEELLNRVGAGETGAIILWSSSRLARNGREWHHVLEVCAVFHTLIIDGDGIFDPRLADHQLWLGMKASFSEYEVKQLQALARAALKSKASRGQLFHNLPAGFVRTADDRIELDPDQRVQQIIRMLFARFEELGSINQVFKWCHRERIEIPVRLYQNGVRLTWRLATYSTLNLFFTNPLYAGIYQYPKTTTRTRIVDGRVVKTSGHRVKPEDNPILIENLFASYITADQFKQIQKTIENNTQRRGNMVSGAPRDGDGLLTGLLKCGHCSRTLRVHYPAAGRGPTYYCPRHLKVAHAKSCLRFSSWRLEQQVSAQMLKAVEPLAIEAALLAEENLNRANQQKAEALAYALAQARYEAERIERQFNATEPENHLVSRTLAARWQQALEKVEALKSQHDQVLAGQTPLTDTERARLFELAEDLKTVWDHPNTSAQLKTRLVRLLVKEVWVKALDAQHVHATIHWQGGVHTEFEFRRGRPIAREEHVKEQRSTIEVVQQLALVCDDQQIARILNRVKLTEAKHPSWSAGDVIELRNKNKIAAFSQEQYERRGLVNLKQAAEHLGASLGSVLQLIRGGLLSARQVIKYAPWEIDRRELDKPQVRRAIAALKRGDQIPFHENQQELSL